MGKREAINAEIAKRSRVQSLTSAQRAAAGLPLGRKPKPKGGVVGGGVQGVTADVGGDFYVWPKGMDPRKRRVPRDPYYRNV